LLRARQPLTPEVVASLQPNERSALATLRGALAFAESQGLAHCTSYRHLVDLPKDELVQVVTAAPANELAPKTWWFPIVGTVSYRGYFEAARAEAFAAELRGEGYDVYVRPASLYSTLGWFDDPLPRPLLAWSEDQLADTVVHEQLHRTVFVAGDIAYDEALASFVAHRITLAYLADRPELQARARAEFADELVFAHLLAKLRAELAALYATHPTPEASRQQRAPIFARYQHQEFEAQPWQSKAYAGFAHAALSNAWLAGFQDYVGLLPCFEKELETLQGDLPAFIRAHREHPGHRAPECETAQ
jgi:predicted aminopeptidase